jgi:hypothetical protein
MNFPNILDNEADVAASCGGELAIAAGTSTEFASSAAYAIEGAARLETADMPH